MGKETFGRRQEMIPDNEIRFSRDQQLAPASDFYFIYVFSRIWKTRNYQIIE